MKSWGVGKTALIFALFGPAAFASRAPNKEITPGVLCRATDPEFAERRYREHVPVCRRNVAPAVIEAVFREYRIAEKRWSDFTIDHLIPLALGGSNAKKNLWPEPKEVKDLRFNLENTLYLKLKAGTLTHSQAVSQMLQAKFNPPPPAHAAE